MSLMQLAKGTPAELKVVKTKDSRPYRIWKKAYFKGPVEIDFDFHGEDSISALMFYGVDPFGK